MQNAAGINARIWVAENDSTFSCKFYLFFSTVIPLTVEDRRYTCVQIWLSNVNIFLNLQLFPKNNFHGTFLLEISHENYCLNTVVDKIIKRKRV